MKWLSGLLVVALWAHQASAKWPAFSWLVHGLFALPLCLFGPWAPFAVFAYREGEQALHAHLLAKQPVTRSIVVDRVMDVLVPALVGWLLG